VAASVPLARAGAWTRPTSRSTANGSICTVPLIAMVTRWTFCSRFAEIGRAAGRFLERATGQHGEPEKITIDKSGADTAAIDSYNAEHEADIEMRQCKYLNNIVEQDHRAIKRIMRPMLGFKSMHCARILLAGIETMHMIQKGQLGGPKGKVASAAKQFYSLAF
jgi:hypothetical protein